MARKIRYKEPSERFSQISSPSEKKEGRASIGMDKFVGEYFYIDIEKLIPYSNQARKKFNEEELEQLAKTIETHGIRQPLSIIESTLHEEKYEVVSGERRLRAAKIAGLKKVPCIILDAQSQKEEIAIIENVQRADLHPIELARGLKKLTSQHGWGGQLEIEKRLGIPQSRVSECLKLLTLSEEVQELCLEKNYTGRDKLMNLFKSTEERQKEIIRGDRVKGFAQKFSVLRVFYEENSFKTQKNALKKLTLEQKKELKDKLMEILHELGE